jgi:hypothetical protein
MKRKVLPLLSCLSIAGLTLTIGVLGGSGRAIAEGGCPDGMRPYQDANMINPGCTGIENYQPNDGNNDEPSQQTKS